MGAKNEKLKKMNLKNLGVECSDFEDVIKNNPDEFIF